MTSIFGRLGAAALTVLATSAFITLGATAAHAAEPLGVADDFYGTQGTPYVGDAPGLLANDICDGVKTLFAVENYVVGEVGASADGSFLYQPAPSFTGTTGFDYSWYCDSVLMPLVHVSVTFSPIVPVGQADTYSTQEGVVLTVPAPGLLANDTNGLAVVDIQNLPDGLNAQLDGSFVYTPPAGLVGDVSFAYRMSVGSDTLSDWIPVTISVTATPVVTNDPPAETPVDSTPTLAQTGEAHGWLLTPALALLVAGCAAVLFATRRTSAL